MDSYMHNRPSSALKMKVSTARKMVEDEEDDTEEEGGVNDQDGQFGGVEYNLKKTKLIGFGVDVAGGKGSGGAVGGGGGKAGKAGGGGVAAACCQVEKCEADLSDAKKYHKRHKVCEVHAKAAVVIVAGLRQRFCQQCSRFHVLSEFDDAKRSCRRRLAGHNERRRKSSSECRGEGSSQGGSGQYLKENQCIQVDESRNSQRAFPGGSSLKNINNYRL